MKKNDIISNVFDKYILLMQIGSGGNACVWMAENVDNGNKVAIKFVKRESNHHEVFNLGLLRSARARLFRHTRCLGLPVLGSLDDLEAIYVQPPLDRLVLTRAPTP